MKSVIRVVIFFLIVAALAIVAVRMFAPSEQETAVPSRAVTEQTPSPVNAKKTPPPSTGTRPVPEQMQAVPAPALDTRVEPTDPPRFEDLPPEKQREFFEGRKARLDEMYARRFKMSPEEWNALSPKEQRTLIRKGTRE